MSINMQDSDIKSVLMLIGELTGLNIVVSPAVKDTITANLENVSIKAALDVILNLMDIVILLKRISSLSREQIMKL